MTQLFENGASSTLLGAIGSGDTVIVVQAGDGSLYPAIAATGDFFAATLEDVSGNTEIVTVVSRTSDSFTVVRGAEGTSSLPFADGSRFELRVTKETLENFAQKAGDSFTGVISVPGIDFLTSDDTVHPVFQQRYNEVDGVPTWTLAGPITEPAALLFETYRAANTVWEWGVDETGRQLTTGAVRHAWHEAQTGDPAWYIDETVTRPAANEMQVQHIPSAGAINVSHLFEVVDAAGVRRQIILNTDGSVAAQGDFSLGSLTMPLLSDPDLEEMQVVFDDGEILFTPNVRVLTFSPSNLSGDAGAGGTGIAYQFNVRTDAGVAGAVTIFPDGTLWSTGQAVFTKVTVADQGVPSNVAPAELVTKSTAEQILALGVGAISTYFSELLYDSPTGVGSGIIALAHPLFLAPGTTHYEQFLVEGYFPNATSGPVYSSLLLETKYLRLSTFYAVGPGQGGDNSGNVKFQVNALYDQLTVAQINGGVIRRVIGISFRGDPFP